MCSTNKTGYAGLSRGTDFFHVDSEQTPEFKGYSGGSSRTDFLIPKNERKFRNRFPVLIANSGVPIRIRTRGPRHLNVRHSLTSDAGGAEEEIKTGEPSTSAAASYFAGCGATFPGGD